MQTINDASGTPKMLRIFIPSQNNKNFKQVPLRYDRGLTTKRD